MKYIIKKMRKIEFKDDNYVNNKQWQKLNNILNLIMKRNAEIELHDISVKSIVNDKSIKRKKLTYECICP